MTKPPPEALGALRGAWLFLGSDAWEVSPHHPKGTEGEQLSSSAMSPCAGAGLGRRAEGHNASIREGIEGGF